MNVLVIGSGAREDAITRTLRAFGHDVAAAPGNPGMKIRGATIYSGLKAGDTAGLIQLAGSMRPNLTIVGPELPLSLGLVDRWPKGLPIFGPSEQAARLETSKAFAKYFMERHGVPTAPFTVCETIKQAIDAASEFLGRCVVKADGLAAGKGAYVCGNMAEVEAALTELMIDRVHGVAGDVVLVEERLEGPECSAIYACDGTNALALKKAQDYKLRYNHNKGPNTGGMGAHCPVFEDVLLDQKIREQIVEPTLAGMAEEGYPFRGFLYVGLMLTAHGPKVIEFNVRLGDPEASVILPLLKTDLAEVLLSGTSIKGLAGGQLEWLGGYCVGVVAVTTGYPSPKLITGFPITGIKEAEDEENCIVFHAGTKWDADKECLVSAGGRVLNVVGWDDMLLLAATTKAYRGVGRIRFEYMDFRKDIPQIP